MKSTCGFLFDCWAIATGKITCREHVQPKKKLQGQYICWFVGPNWKYRSKMYKSSRSYAAPGIIHPAIFGNCILTIDFGATEVKRAGWWKRKNTLKRVEIKIERAMRKIRVFEKQNGKKIERKHSRWAKLSYCRSYSISMSIAFISCSLVPPFAAFLLFHSSRFSKPTLRFRLSSVAIFAYAKSSGLIFSSFRLTFLTTIFCVFTF